MVNKWQAAKFRHKEKLLKLDLIYHCKCIKITYIWFTAMTSCSVVEETNCKSNDCQLQG